MQAKRVVLVAASAAMLMTGCGKKGPLIYPDMLIAQPPQQLKVEQSGAALRLSFNLPDKDRSGRKLEDLEAILLGRRVYQENDCVSCQDQYQVLQKIDPAFPAPAQQRQGNRIIVTDTDVRHGERYQYRLQTVQKGGITGGAVTTVMVKLLAAPQTPELKARSAFGGFIALDINGSVPQDATLVGYTIYRAEGSGPLAPLTTLTAAAHYEDQTVQRGVVYRYAASVVIKRTDGVQAESEPSPAVSISVADDPG